MAAKPTTNRRGHSEAFINAPRIRAVDHCGCDKCRKRATDDFLNWYRKEHIMPSIKVAANGRIFIDGKLAQIFVTTDKTGGPRNGAKSLVKNVAGQGLQVLADVPGKVWNDPDALKALVAEHV